MKPTDTADTGKELRKQFKDYLNDIADHYYMPKREKEIIEAFIEAELRALKE